VPVVRRCLVVLLALIVVPTATAALSVTLTTASPANFAGVTLNGLDQTKTLNLSVTVANTGGTASDGWQVTMASTLPTFGGDTLTALNVTAVSRGNCTGGGCVNPTNSVTYPIDLTTGGVKIYNAALNTGKGTVVLTPTVQMTYDADAIVGTYAATLTVAGSLGP
jgi:hypothetical protein